MFTIEMLAADHGDCLWIEYGDELKPHRILIDGGTPGTCARLKARIEALPEAERRFELFIVTHIDADHIGGAVELLDEPPAGLAFGDVWFNGFRHLPAPRDEQGVAQGEELTRALVEKHKWNEAFNSKAVVVPDEGSLPQVRLAGDLTLTLLSPAISGLVKLYPKWDKELAKLRAQQGDEPAPAGPGDEMGEGLDVAALAARPFKEDGSVPNGSGIAVLAEYQGKRLLLAADAHPRVLGASVDRLLAASGDPQLSLDVLKVSHHGSRANTSKKLLDKLAVSTYLISTSGAVFNHPDREGIARLIAYGGREKTLYFNYRTEYNEMWDSPELENKLRYDARFESKVRIGA